MSDPSRTIAEARQYLPAENAVAGLQRLADELGATEIIVGLPLKMDGTWSNSTHAVRDFVAELRNATDVNIATWDERLSTVQAERAMIESGMRRRKRREKIDSAAAVVILQGYLDSQRASSAVGT